MKAEESAVVNARTPAQLEARAKEDVEHIHDGPGGYFPIHAAL